MSEMVSDSGGLRCHVDTSWTPTPTQHQGRVALTGAGAYHAGSFRRRGMLGEYTARIAGYALPVRPGVDSRNAEIPCPVWGVRRHLMDVKTLSKGEVFERYGVELTRFATSLVGPTEAQDVVSDALLRSMWSDGWEDVANQRAYLYRAVVSQVRMNHRSAGRRRERERRASPLVVAAQFDGEVDVWEALGHLSVSERAVVFLAYWADLCEVDAAARLGVSERTIRRHLGRARHKLGRLLHG